MKKALKYILLVVTCFTLLTCKKYDEGGFVRQTCKNLFGGNKAGDSKTWKLKKYEVNGIDSTYLINTGGIPDFYEKFLTLKLESKKEFNKYTGTSGFYLYEGKVSTNYREIVIGNLNSLNTIQSQCGILNNNSFCSRNILYPDLNPPRSWSIIKLTNKEFILTIQKSNTYKVILTS
ncbi:MAG TPA: hypothetical protein PLU73_03685 [Bacteroidia bacterium]|nr:hypothetical protein [Bacteroidia bacterium]